MTDLSCLWTIGKDNLGRLVSKIRVPKVLIVAAVCVLVFMVHWPAMSAKALSFDDSQYLTRNVLVQNPGWTSAKRLLTEILEPSTVGGYYQPLAMISLMLDYALGGRESDLMPFHRTSLILHTANTALIIVLLYLLFGQIWVAAGVGLLFGVHPMTVEPIPWVGERKTLLAAFFSLWSLVFYVRYTQKSNRGFYLGSFAMYFLALMSKPTSVPIPAVMLLMDFWPLRRLNWRAVWEKVPFFVLGGIFAVITYISQSRTIGARSPGEFGIGRVFLVLCHNIVFYLYKIVWPVNLTSHYAFPQPLDLSQSAVLAGVIGTFILILLLAISLHWTRAAMTGWLAFFAVILPTMQIVGFSDVIASDKFAYLPSVGLLMVLTSFLIGLFGKSYVAESSILRVILVMAMLIPAGLESIATRRYLVYWQDSVSLYGHMLAIAPNSASLHNGLGNVFYSQGRVGEAVGQYQEAMLIDPGEASTYNNMGTALLAGGRLDEALNYFQESLRLSPNRVSALNNVAWILLMHPDNKVRDVNQAVDLAERAAKLTHYEDVYVLNTLALAYITVGRTEDALNTAQKAFGFASAAGDSNQAEQIKRQIEALKEQKAEKKENNP